MPSEIRQRGYSIRIFLADGNPEGVRTVEKSNWNGRGTVCPRSRFPEAKLRTEFALTGVYFLWAPPIGPGDFPTLYIGECDPLRPRLEQHYAKKDFWTQAIVFTSSNGNLNKAHVQYLESRLVAQAKEAKRCTLDNQNNPGAPSLSEADIAEMESFLDEVLLILPVIGLHAFEKPQTTKGSNRTLMITGKGCHGSGYESDEGFVVLNGSEMRQDAVESIHPYMATLRSNLISKGIVAKLDGALKLTQDYTFNSPSTAAGVLLV